MNTPLQLFCNIRIADDGTGDQLRKECHICSQVYRISLGFHILPVYIHRIAEYLEGIKADSDGKCDVKQGNRTSGDGIYIADKKICVFKITKHEKAG